MCVLQEARTWNLEPVAKPKAGKAAQLDFSAKGPDGSPLEDRHEVVAVGKSLVDVEDDVSSSEDEVEMLLCDLHDRCTLDLHCHCPQTRHLSKPLGSI